MATQTPSSASTNTDMVNVWSLRSDVATLDVFSIGGAMHNLVFQLPDGSEMKPLAEAPWQSKYIVSKRSNRPRHIELLGGEWPCVPFGSSHHDPAHHGFGTDHHWHVDTHTENNISLSIDYPADHSIRRLEREISLPDGETTVEVSLRIFARHDVALPIGVHPVLKIPDGLWSLVSGTFLHATTPPNRSRPNRSKILSETEIGASGHVKLDSGEVISIWQSPSILTDELIQLWSIDGNIELLDHDAGVATRIEWDPDDFPHCLLWFANPGISIDEMGQQFHGLGIEPINSNFDGIDPDAQLHIGAQLTPEKCWSTSYRISCHSLNHHQTESHPI